MCACHSGASNRRPAIFTALVVLILFGATARTTVAPKPATHTVVIDGVQFVPATLRVRAGDTVVWVNKDPFPHTATSEAGDFDSREIASGKSWTLVAEQKGEFAYVCVLHPTMKGVLGVVSR